MTGARTEALIVPRQVEAMGRYANETIRHSTQRVSQDCKCPALCNIVQGSETIWLLPL